MSDYRTPDTPGFLGGFQFKPKIAWCSAFLLLQWPITEWAGHLVMRGGALFSGSSLWMSPLTTWWGLPIYQPCAWWCWAVSYWRWLLFTTPPYSSPLRWCFAFLFVSFLLCRPVPALVNTLKARRLATNQDHLYGSSKWADRKELEEAGLLNASPGVLLTGWREANKPGIRYLYDNSDRHTLLVAPTGLGKTFANCIPTVLVYRGSLIVLDIKEEIHRNTAGYRQRTGNICLKWSPTQKEGCTRINPLSFIRIGTDHEVADCQMVAEALCQPGNEGEGSSHWNDTSSSVVAGLILHECYRAQLEKSIPTLKNVSLLLSPKDRTITELFQAIASYAHDPQKTRGWQDDQGQPTVTHPIVAEKMAEALQRAEDEGSSVISTAKKRFGLFSDPLVCHATSDSDFTIEQLVDGEKPVSLYLVIPPNHQERLSLLVRLVVLTLLDRLVEKQAAHKHELLFMLDEFAQLGQLKPMKTALTYVRGYGIRFYLIVQNVGQIETAYGLRNNIIPNCQNIVAYTPAPSDVNTAETLCKMLGTMTVQHMSYNVSGPSQILAEKNLSMQVQNTKRDLMEPAEILRLNLPKKEGKKVVKPGESLAFVFGCMPIKGAQTFCFFDPQMARWMKIRPLDQSRLLREEKQCA